MRSIIHARIQVRVEVQVRLNYYRLKYESGLWPFCSKPTGSKAVGLNLEAAPLIDVGGYGVITLESSH